MKQLISVLMMFLCLLVGFQQALYFMHYELNKKQIEKEHCININKPEMKCHGFCYLKKKLEKAENNSAEKALVNTYKKVDMFSISRVDILPISNSVEVNEKEALYIEVSYKEPEQKIFIPPPIVRCFTK